MTKWVGQLWSILVGHAQKINGLSDHHMTVSFGPMGRTRTKLASLIRYRSSSSVLIHQVIIVEGWSLHEAVDTPSDYCRGMVSV